MEAAKTVKVAQELFTFEHTVTDLSMVYVGALFSARVSAYAFLLITAAFLSARGAGMLLNRYAGREFDVINKKKRGMQSLLISQNAVLYSAIVLSSVFVTSAYLLNTLSFALSFLLIALFLIDPHLKKYTHHRHFSVGSIIGLGVLGGYIGATGNFPSTVPLYFITAAAVLLVTSADIIYTIRHSDFDKKHGLKTYVVSYGEKKARINSRYLNIFASILILIFGITSNSLTIFAGTSIAMLVLIASTEAVYGSSKSTHLTFVSIETIIWLLLLVSVYLGKYVIHV